MSASHEHHTIEKKPVAFTAPFILACVTLLFVISFLSLCDPDKAHQLAGNEGCIEACEEHAGSEADSHQEHEQGDEVEQNAESQPETTAEASVEETKH